MIYGMNIAASGVVTSMYRQNVFANNLANINTVGYRPDVPVLRQRDAARIEDDIWDSPSNAMLERLGAGVLLAPNRLSQRQGPLEVTNDPLNFAIDGEGFFVVSTDASGGQTERVRFSRDGQFVVDPLGRLVTAGSGLPVLDVADRPIMVDRTAPLSVDAEGNISQRGNVVARLQIAAVPNPGLLKKVGNNLLMADAAAVDNRTAATGVVKQGHLERSGVDSISAMMQVASAASAVSSGGRMIQLFDELAGRAISTFGRVA